MLVNILVAKLTVVANKCLFNILTLEALFSPDLRSGYDVIMQVLQKIVLIITDVLMINELVWVVCSPWPGHIAI